MIGLSEIRSAQQRIAGKVHRTPMTTSRTLSRKLDLKLSFKLELFQKTGSFKVRGVLNRLQHLSAEERRRGVVSMSSGNHAQALAYGAATLGIPAVIAMPQWSRRGKVEARRGYGGQVILTERPLMEVVDELQEERGLTMVHPFDDPLVIAGQGTVGLEIVEDSSQPDVVLVTVGGGGLISGIAIAVKEAFPQCRVVGIEPEGAAAVTRGLEAGRPVTLEKVDTICDGLAAPFAGKETLPVVQEYVDKVILVSDAEVVEALRLIVDRLKVVAEPSAAAALAPVLSGRLKLPSGAATVCVLCGGNVDSRTLSELLS